MRLSIHALYAAEKIHFHEESDCVAPLRLFMEDRESSSPETEFRAVKRQRERGGREKVNLTISKASPGADITA
jgi:hypothetical protein